MICGYGSQIICTVDCYHPKIFILYIVLIENVDLLFILCSFLNFLGGKVSSNFVGGSQISENSK